MAPLELRAHPELLKISNEDRPMQVFLVGMPRSGTMCESLPSPRAPPTT